MLSKLRLLVTVLAGMASPLTQFISVVNYFLSACWRKILGRHKGSDYRDTKIPYIHDAQPLAASFLFIPIEPNFKSITFFNLKFMQPKLRLLLVTFSVIILSFVTTIAFGQATVTTDKPDYAPRSTAVFTGSGFLPGETVALKVKNLFQPCHTVSADSSYLPWTVTADGSGSFVTTWIVCDCDGDSLRLKASGQTSGLIAYAYFTDASFTGSWTSVTPSNTCAGSSASYTLIASNPPSAASNADVPVGKAVEITFPLGFNLGGISSGTLNGTAIGTITTTSTTVTFSNPVAFNKNTTITIVLNGIVNNSTAGNYQISMKIDNNTGTGTGNQNLFPAGTSSQFTINVLPTPTFTISPTATTCVSTDVTYTTQSGKSNYIWSIPGTLGADYTITAGGAGTASSTVTLKWLTIGSKTVTLNYTSGGCSGASPASSTTTVQANVTPSVTIAQTAGSNPSCSGSSVTFTATASNTGGGTATYTFKEGAATLQSGASSTYTTTSLSAGSHTITCDVSISGGTCLTATTATTATGASITVNALITANAGLDQTVTGNTATLAGNDPSPGTGLWTIVGTPNDGTFGNAAVYNTTFTGTTGNTYTLRWTVTNAPCASSSDDVSITLNPATIATTTTIDAANATYGGASVDLVAHVSPAAATGSVEFYVDGSLKGSAALSSGSATYSYSLTGVGARLHILKAKYLGAGVYTASETDPESAGSLLVNKAASTTTVTITGAPFTYTGAAQTPATVSVTGAGGLSLTPTADYANNTNAGTATASYTYAGDANHEGSADSKDFTIGKKSLTAQLIGSVTKVYNATDVAILVAANYSLLGVIVGDNIILNNPTSGTYNNKNVGSGKNVSVSGLSVSGSSINNYMLTSNTANANIGAISARTVNVTAQPDSRIYNGTTGSAVLPIVDPLQGTDVVTSPGVQVYNNKHAGTGKTLTPSGSVISDGNSGNNYAINYVTNANGVITQKSINLTAQAATKVYDGNTSSTVTPLVDALETGDTRNAPIETYDTKQVGTGKTLTPSGLVINDGNSGNNYTVNVVLNTNGVITKKNVKVTAKTATKVFDGNTSSLVTPTVETLQGDDVIGTQPIQVYDNPNQGTGKVMTPSGLAINDGNGGENYNIIYEAEPVGTITKYSVTTAATATPSPVQYSDQVTMTASITGGAALIAGGGPKAATTASFTIGGQSMGSAPLTVSGSDLVATLTVPLLETTVTGSMAPGLNKAVIVSFDDNSNFVFNTNPVSTAINVIQEDATVDYTGDELLSTGSSNSTATTVTLRANISDINVTSPGTDANPGDIRNAKVKFLVTLNGSPVTVTGAKPDGWWTVDSLVVVGDKRIGMVKATFPANLGNSQDAEYDVRVIVGDDGSNKQGYYIAEEEKAVVTVYKPTGDFITGGGQIINTNSEGSMKGDYGSKTNFGFNVKLNKTGKNLQGNLNFIFRRKVGGVLRSYQVKANAMQSLAVNATNVKRQTANFVSKCNLTDITNLNAPVSLGGNLFMYVNMVDNGEPGTKDSISFVLVDGQSPDPTILSNIIYTSNWVGNMTQMKNLSGGNLVVHSGFNLGSASTAPLTTIKREAAPLIEPGIFTLRAYPNPSNAQFTLQIASSDVREKVQVRIMDMSGRVIQEFNNLNANQSMQIGGAYRPGVYIVEMIQGGNRKQLKLIKQPN